MKGRLFTPGPTPIPEGVMLEMAQPIMHHRHPEFEAIFARVNDNLRYLFQTKGDVLTFASSGTGAMEGAFASLFRKGDKIINVNGGKFGDRWTKVPTAYGLNVVEIPIEWGKSVTAGQIGEALKSNPDAKAVVMVHSETSTGAAIDLKSIAERIRSDSDALVIVDGITSVGAMEVRSDDWGLDVVVTGSQKGLMLPPGLSFASVSEKAFKMGESGDLPNFYFSFGAARKALGKGTTPYTPAVTLVVGADRSLEMIRKEGIENVWARHQLMAEACRAGIRGLGLTLFAENPSNAVTSVLAPDGVDGGKVVKTIKAEAGITIAGGQDHLKGKIFRLSHLGYYDRFDMVTVMAALEGTLRSLSYEFEPGAGVAAVQKVLLGD